MNFIEAHEIFYDYCGALGKGNFYNTELPCGGDFLYYDVELNNQLVQHIKKHWNYILTHNV